MISKKMNVLLCPSYTSFGKRIHSFSFPSIPFGTAASFSQSSFVEILAFVLNKQMPSETPFGELKNSFLAKCLEGRERARGMKGWPCSGFSA